MFTFIQRHVTLVSLIVMLLSVVLVAGCAPVAAPSGAESGARPFTISAIPDQDPEKLQRLYGGLADYLSTELGVPVVYKPVTDYTASVTAFNIGDLDMVWFGGLTGVQARLQTPGAEPIAQRDIDANKPACRRAVCQHVERRNRLLNATSTPTFTASSSPTPPVV